MRYVRYILEELLARSENVVVILPQDAMNSVEYFEALHCYSAQATFEFSIPPHPSKGWGNLYIRWRSLLGGILKYRPEIALVPTADGLAQALGLAWFWLWKPAVRSCSVRCVLLRFRFGVVGRDLRDRVRQLLSLMLLSASPWQRFFSIDQRPVQSLKNLYIRFPRIDYLPDPIDKVNPVTQADACRLLGLDPRVCYIGCAGILEERKGVDLLVAAYLRVASGSEVHLLLAGEATPKISEILREACAREKKIIWINRRLSEDELSLFMLAMNTICLLYIKHLGLSSFVLRAAACGRFVLGCREGWIGATIRAHQLGWTCEPEMAGDLEAALRQVLLSAKQGASFPPTEWLKDHSPSNFTEKLVHH